MIVPEEMREAVHREVEELAGQRAPPLVCLSRRVLDGDDHVAERLPTVMSKARALALGERQDVGRVVLARVPPVERVQLAIVGQGERHLDAVEPGGAHRALQPAHEHAPRPRRHLRAAPASREHHAAF
jgi:hypothetical protein